MLAIIVFAMAAFALLHDRLGGPMHLFSPEQYARFLSLNAWSVAGVTALAALRYSSAYADIANRRGS
jgi:hypothetical protein